MATAICSATAVLQPDPADAQSFDCRHIRYPDEVRICEEPELAQLDQQLAMLYRDQIGKIPKEQQDEFQRHEALFLNARRKCHDDYRCIELSYRNRINELEGFLSEARREEESGNTASPDPGSEHLIEPRDHRSTGSERPPEPTPSRSTAATETTQPREASGSTTERDAESAPAKPTIRWVDPPPGR